MKTFLVALLLALLTVIAVAAPVNDTAQPTKKGPQFISSFDEIVVESSLTVRGKDNGRQGKKLVVVTPKTTTVTAETTTTAKSS